MTNLPATTNGNGAVFKYEANKPIGTSKSLQLFTENVKSRIMAVLPKHMSPDRFLRILLVSATKTPRILQCTQESILIAVMRAAELGLEPSGATGDCYLVPYRRKDGTYECQLQIGYRGLARLARNSGEIKRIEAEVVHVKDLFDYQKGTESKLVYKPYCPIDVKEDRGHAIGAYALVEFKDGGIQDDFMNVADIERIKRRSKSGNDGPWVTDWDEMAKKTVFRRMAKWLPLSSEKFQAAIETDNDTFDLPAASHQDSDLNELLEIGVGDDADEASFEEVASQEHKDTLL